VKIVKSVTIRICIAIGALTRAVELENGFFMAWKRSYFSGSL